ncbi:MAG: SPFH domain-containing protein [Phycisphaerales bacterium]|nr:SPFH domain-containing protein [Phycisphaerales bacterium]
MKRSEFLAWLAFIGLLVIAAILLTGGIMYGANFFWAGTCLAVGQAFVVALAVWGLRLASQRAELEELAPPPLDTGPSAFRMSYEESGQAISTNRHDNIETKTLDTSFQRLLVALSAITLLGLAVIVSFLVYRSFGWHRLHPDKPFPIAGAFDKPMLLDELALVMILASAAIYVLLYWNTRITRATYGTGEAASSNFTLGLPAAVALAAAGILAYFRVEYVSDIASGITAALLALQGLELFLNATRSYSAIEELDQPAVDLQVLPLVPMLSSVWLSSVKMLFAQSLGLSRDGQQSVIGRLMPRTLAACVVIAIIVSCFRSVPPGQVAIIERLGKALTTTDGKQTLKLLQPGLHLTFPWPIDQLVTIPTQELQLTDVGVELHGDKNIAANLKKIDFQFWTVRTGPQDDAAADLDNQFITGDPRSPQILETYVAVLWRVSDPEKFYHGLSHSEFYEQSGEVTKAATPIYVEIVQQCTSFAVTRTFATHTLEQIMATDRQNVEANCKQILQAQLDNAGTGITIVSLNITDLHPPLGGGKLPLDPARPEAGPIGPADAYENIVNAMQFKEQLIQNGNAQRITAIREAQGAAATTLNEAKASYADRIANAKGEADRIETMIGKFPELVPGEEKFMTSLAQRQAMYNSLKDAFAPVNKILVDPSVNKIDLYQTNPNTPNVPRPLTP